MVKLSSICPLPHLPLDAFQPSRSALTEIRSPVGQKDAGRKCSSSSLNQCQPPGTGLDMLTVMWDRTACWAAVVFTEWSNMNTMGWPTPALSPAEGHTDAVTRAVGTTVAKEVARSAATPSARATPATTR